MDLLLQREPSAHGCTIGELTLGGVLVCHILEDVIREVPGEPVASWKVKGETAIPAGRYKVVITHSPRFKRLLPLLLDVPGFEGIRIHTGNTADHTEGCLIPGRKVLGAVVDSRKSYDILEAHIEHGLAVDGEVWIEIRNP